MPHDVDLAVDRFLRTIPYTEFHRPSAQFIRRGQPVYLGHPIDAFLPHQGIDRYSFLSALKQAIWVDQLTPTEDWPNETA